MCRLPSSWIKMKLFPTERNVYLLWNNSLETTVTGVYIPWNHCFLESIFAFLQRPESPLPTVKQLTRNHCDWRLHPVKPLLPWIHIRLSSKTWESLYEKTWFYKFLKKGESFQEGRTRIRWRGCKRQTNAIMILSSCWR